MTFGGLDALFNPSKQLMDEEKLRLQSTREEIGDSSGGKRIDLDSGRVRLGRPADDDDVDGPPGPNDGEPDGAERDDADRDDVPRADLDGERADTESAAVQRARARRRKPSSS